MDSSATISGLCPPRFAAVRDAFAGNFAAGEELGARFTAIVDGEVIVDLWGGWADRHQQTPFDGQTLTPVFSSTKAVAALMLARLAGDGRLDYAQTVASLWPAYGAAGKDKVSGEQARAHQDGRAGRRGPFDAEEWFDTPAMVARIAAAEPLWPPVAASG